MREASSQPVEAGGQSRGLWEKTYQPLSEVEVVVDRTSLAENQRVVGSCQPSENQIRRGAEEYALLEREQSNTWVRWKHVIRALNLIDMYAMREAKINAPRGGKFNRVVRKFLQCYGLDRIHKSDRSRIRKYTGKLEIIDVWRSKQPLERQLALNHPRVVYECWSRSVRSASTPRKKEPRSKNSDAVADLLAALSKATDTEVTAVLTAYGFASFLRVMPGEWRPQLEARIIGLRAEDGHPELKITAILRKALSLAKTAATSGISRPVADSNEREALVALTQLNTLLACGGLDLNDIVLSTVKTASRSRRRAA